MFEIQSIKAKPILNLCVKNAFIEAFSTMFFDFKDYLYKIDDFTVFDTKMLLNNRQEEDHAFYKEVTESQLFINFIQNISKNEDDYIYFNDILNNLKINKDNTCINQFKHTTNQTEVVHFYMKHNFIHSTYIIKPLFCEKVINDQSQMSHFKINKNAFGLSDQSSQVLNEERRVITKPWTLNKTDYPSVIERYVIPGIDKSTVRKRPQTIFKKVDLIEKNMEKNKTQTIIKRSKKEYELTRNQKEDIKEIIKDTLSSIFRSGVDINITPALKEIYRSFGREFFCKLVYQSNSIKKIQPDCFNQLVKLFLNGLISMCNISENDNTLECAVQLTKSSFYYCKGNTGDFLYDELKMKLKDYFLWLKDSFWFKWLDVDLKERSNTEEKEKEKNYIKLIENICDKMLKLQVNKEYIIKFINSLLVVYVSKVILNKIKC